jgi:bacteriocin-like protein
MVDEQNQKHFQEEPEYNPEQELDDEELSAISGGVTDIVSPRDPASGLPTGKRMHKPFTLNSDLDA